MKKFIPLFALTTMSAIIPMLSHAGAYQEENIKMHCVILKNNKVVKQQNCVAESGYVHAGAAYGGGSGYAFKAIKGYGKISVDTSVALVYDEYDRPVTLADGSTKTESSTTLNEKDTIIRYRTPKTFKLLTEQQLTQYDEGQLKFEPYTCFVHTKNPIFEFCFSKPLMG